jgi:hypothetical protein
MQVQRSPNGEIPAATRMRCPACLAVFRTGFDCCPVDGAAIAPCEVGFDPLLGSELAGRYIIEELVGEGSMGLIYRARHTCLPRAFAVKILFGDLVADPRMRIRFAQEAALASRLSHPNVVPVVDFGRSEQGLLFLVMDFIDGEGLGELIARQAPLDSLHAIGLARQLAMGLGHAHRRGLVHRDFKPNNVLLERLEDGPPMPRILDFGLAISTRDRDELPGRLTECGFILGTPVYIAPEQVLDGVVDHRADLFALGVVMYEMLAAQPPFDGRPVEIAHKNVIAPVPWIAERSPGIAVPPALEAIVRRLLEKSPDDRFASADEVCAALDEVEHALTAPAMAAVAPRPLLVPALRPAHAADPIRGTVPRPVDRLRSHIARASRTQGGRLAAAGAMLVAAVAVAFAVAGRPAAGPASLQGAKVAAAIPAAAPLSAVQPAVASAPPLAGGSLAPQASDLAAQGVIAMSQAGGAGQAGQESGQPALAATRATNPPRISARAPVSRAGGDLSGRAEKAAANETAADPELRAAAFAGKAAIAAREVSARARDGAARPGLFGLGQAVSGPAPAAGSSPAAPAPPARKIALPAAPAAPRASGPIIVPPNRAHRERGSLAPIHLPRYEKTPGYVTAKLCIDPDGGVTSVAVLTPVSEVVRDRLSRAFTRARYRPVIEGGEAVAACFATVFRVQVE